MQFLDCSLEILRRNFTYFCKLSVRKGVKSLLRAITNKKQDINVVAVLVRNNSKYRALSDLEGARAYFTGYRSIGEYHFKLIHHNFNQ